MSSAHPPLPSWREHSELPARAASAAAGLAASALILFALTAIRKPALEQPPPPIEDLRSVVLPVDAPPPVPHTEQLPALEESSLIMLPAERSDSVVKLPAMPIVTDDVPRVAGLPRLDVPPATFRPATLDPEFENRHVFDRSEVDQRCVALVKVRPAITSAMLRATKHLRVTFMFVVNKDGSVDGIRLLKSSDNPDLDAACAAALKDWKFNPAVRRGRKVRQWAQQALVFRLDAGSPLEVY